jgi:hypothetical protein
MCLPAKDPPAKEPPDGFIRGKIRACFKQHGAALKIASLVMAGHIALFSCCTVGTLGHAGGFVDPDNGHIIDAASPERTAAGVILTRTVERAIVAENDFQLVCLGITHLHDREDRVHCLPCCTCRCAAHDDCLRALSERQQQRRMLLCMLPVDRQMAMARLLLV